MTAYIIKSSLSLVLMFGLYWFLLRQEKLFVFNRFFLLFAILFSLIIPFISIPVTLWNNEVQRDITSVLHTNIPEIITIQNPASFNSYPSSSQVLHSQIDISKIFVFLYFSGVIVFLFRFLRNIFYISRQIVKSEKINYLGERLALIDHEINPYCFFNTIFVNKQDYLNNKIEKELLSHELEHIKQSHSIDVVLVELIQIIYWFNPILILYSTAIRVNHEYLADNAVTKGSSDIKSYAEKLINYIGSKRNIPLTSGFNPSLTRKRLLMLTKSRSGLINYGTRIFITINLAAVLVMVLSFTPSYSQPLKEVVKQQQETGVSQELLKEYQDILNKYKRTTKDGEDSYHLNQNMPEKERLETMFFQMSKEQQAKQMFVFVARSSMVIPKSTPTVKQFEAFKDPKMYGVWIDGIKVNNSELNKYKNSDFSHMIESILLKNAKDYGKYVSQVSLMTNEGYRTDYEKAIAEKGNILVPNNFNQKHEVIDRGKKTNNEVIEITTKGKTTVTTEIKTYDIDKKVTYNASGYIKQDTINQIIVLTDNASISFDEITIKADSIVFNKRTNQIYAIGRHGSSGTIIGKPIFKEDSQEMEADEITYNLNTRRAFAKNIKAQVNMKLKDSGTPVNSPTHKQIDKSNNDGSNKIKKDTIGSNTRIIYYPNLLYTVGGIQHSHETNDTKTLLNLYTPTIKRIQLFKGEEQVRMYGDRAQSGVIIVTAKSGPLKTDPKSDHANIR